MKVTIKLSDAEVSGIKAYLKEVDDIERPTKYDVAMFINSYIGVIHSPREAVSDYIRRYEMPDWCTEDKHIPGCSCR